MATKIKKFAWSKGAAAIFLVGGLAGNSLAQEAKTHHYFSPAMSQTQVAKVNWKELFAKVFIANIEGDLKITGKAPMREAYINRFVYYSPKPIIRLYDEITAEPTSYKAAHRVRDEFQLKFQGQGSAPDKISNLSFALPGKAGELAEVINRSRNSTVGAEGNKYNYFRTPSGKKVNELMKDYILVIVPGFASHTQDLYSFIEIINDANEFYGRKNSLVPGEFDFAWERPRTKDGANQNVYMSANDFHSSARAPQVGFDVVEPMGGEMGNSLGPNEMMSDKLGVWLQDLLKHEKYAGRDRKLILLGYSKGGPIIHDTVRWAKENDSKLFNSIEYLVTNAAVLQGAIPASEGFKQIRHELALLVGRPVKTNLEAIEIVEGQLKNLRSSNPAAKRQAKMILGLIGQFGGLGATVMNLPIFQQMLGKFGIDPEKLLSMGSEILLSEDSATLLGGLNSMTAYESVKWMLKNMNDKNFSGKTIFNISGVASIKDFLLPLGNNKFPDGFDKFGPINPPQLAPQFVFEGGGVRVDWEKLSLDNMFMHLTSLTGFESSPGGLYDTQVGWMDTKSMALDHRPFSESLDPDEISRLQGELGGPNLNVPDRSTLIRAQAKNVNFVDLADFRGTHWNIAFKQSFVPDKKLRNNGTAPYYKHIFPRRAFHSSIIETIAMYHQLATGQ